MSQLKDLLGEPLFGEVSAALRGKGKDGKDVELAVANDGSFLPKAKFDALNKEYQGLKERWREAEHQFGEVEALHNEKEQLENALRLAREEQEAAVVRYQQQTTEMAKKHCLEKALMNLGAKNSRAVEALVDWEKITYENGDFQGMEEQLGAVKEEAPYLFKTELEPFSYAPQGSKGTTDFSQMSDAEYYEYVNKKG